MNLYPNLTKVAEMSVADLGSSSGYTDRQGLVLSNHQLIAACEQLEQGADGVFLSSQPQWLSPDAVAGNARLSRERSFVGGSEVAAFMLAVISRRPPVA